MTLTATQTATQAGDQREVTQLIGGEEKKNNMQDRCSNEILIRGPAHRTLPPAAQEQDAGGEKRD